MKPDQHKQKASAKYKKKHGIQGGQKGAAERANEKKGGKSAVDPKQAAAAREGPKVVGDNRNTSRGPDVSEAEQVIVTPSPTTCFLVVSLQNSQLGYCVNVGGGDYQTCHSQKQMVGSIKRSVLCTWVVCHTYASDSCACVLQPKAKQSTRRIRSCDLMLRWHAPEYIINTGIWNDWGLANTQNMGS